jgi:hypothetical protein
MPKRKALVSSSSALTADYISKENSTETPALNFDGVYVRSTQYNTISCSVKCNVSGTLTIEHSFSGENFSSYTDYPILPDTFFYIKRSILCPYVRIYFVTNPSVLPTSLSIYTVLRKEGMDVSDLTNEGSGAPIYDPGNLALKSLTSTDNSVLITSTATEIDLKVDPDFVLDNEGTGAEVYDPSNNALRTFISSDNSITINQGAGPEIDLIGNQPFTLSNEGIGAPIYDIATSAVRSLISVDNSLNIGLYGPQLEMINISANQYLNSTSPGLAVGDLRYGNIAGFTTAIAGALAPINIPGTVFSSANASGLPYFDTPSAGRVRFIGNQQRMFGVNVCMSGHIASGAAQDWAIYVYKNGNPITSAVSYFTTGNNTTLFNVSLQCGALLNPNDYLQVWGDNITNGAELVIEAFNLMAIGDGDSIITSNIIFSNYNIATSFITLDDYTTTQNAIIPLLPPSSNDHLQNVTYNAGDITVGGNYSVLLRIFLSCEYETVYADYIVIGYKKNGVFVTTPSKNAAISYSQHSVSLDVIDSFNPGDIITPILGRNTTPAAILNVHNFRCNIFSVNNLGFYPLIHNVGQYQNNVSTNHNVNQLYYLTFPEVIAPSTKFSFTPGGNTFTALYPGIFTYNFTIVTNNFGAFAGTLSFRKNNVVIHTFNFFGGQVNYSNSMSILGGDIFQITINRGGTSYFVNQIILVLTD